MKRLHEENRLGWNEATRAHNSHKGDQAAFLRAGGSTLFPEELELLGDVRGLDLVHLLCNSGQDTLSLAALGARVTGVDISDEAIAFARRLSADSGLPAHFVRADVYDWLHEAAAAGASFDVAFLSYGALVWLSDLGAFVRGAAALLRPGGRLAMVEFHPVLWMFDEAWRHAYPYSTHGAPITEKGVSDYVASSGELLVPWGFEEGARGFENPYPGHSFAWGLGELVDAVAAAGLRVETVREHEFANGVVLAERMRILPGRRTAPPAALPAIPLMFSLAARR